MCGFLGCDLQPFNPLIAALPRLLHLRADADNAWIASFTQQAAAESHAHAAPAAEAMLARMSEMMFVDAVRRHAERLPADSAGWLAGLRDRFVGRALALLHERPARDWTHRRARPPGRPVALGAARALRRAGRRRADAVPGAVAHAGRWRACCSRARATVAAIALEVGYESEAAFARAFKRRSATPPAAWRRDRQAASDATREGPQSARAPTITAASNIARAGRDSGST